MDFKELDTIKFPEGCKIPIFALDNEKVITRFGILYSESKNMLKRLI